MSVASRAVALMIALCACRDAAGPSDAATLAVYLRQLASAESYLTVGLGRGGAPELPALGDVPADCIYNSATTFFDCPTTTAFTLEVNRSYQLLDKNSNSLASFDLAKVDAIYVLTAVTGTVTYQATQFLGPTSITFSSQGTHILRGIGTFAPYLVGTTTTTAAATKNDKTKTTLSYQTTNGLVPSASSGQFGAAGTFPKAGAVSSMITGTDTTGVALPSTSVITTFNGTPTVMSKVTTGGTTTTWACEYTTSSGGNPVIFVVCTLQ